MIWKPNVTVAAVIERDGKFLLVEEETSQGVRFNQPTGHLEADESLLAAVAREVLEESAHSFTPQHLLGIYHWYSPESDATYLRFALTGAITGHDSARKLDIGILQVVWLLTVKSAPLKNGTAASRFYASSKITLQANATRLIYWFTMTIDPARYVPTPFVLSVAGAASGAQA